MKGERFIKFERNFVNHPIVKCLSAKCSLFELWYIKMILYSQQVENENYGYISMVIGQVKLNMEQLARMMSITYSDDFEDFVQLAKDWALIEIEDTRIKVIYPWDREPQRMSKDYMKWKNAVLERDQYCCAMCGSDESIEVHHKIPWQTCKDDDELRYSVDNGICLCYACHKKVHGGKWR